MDEEEGEEEEKEKEEKGKGKDGNDSMEVEGDDEGLKKMGGVEDAGTQEEESS